MAGTKLVNADLEVQGSIKLTTTPNNTGSILTKHTDGTISVRTPAQIKSDIGANFTAGSGLTLSGTTFSLPVTISGTGSFVQSVAQNTNGITVTLGTPPNTTYSTGSLAELNAGTVSTGRLWGSNVLNSWLTGKLPSPQTLSLVDEADISISDGNTIALHSLRSRGIGWDVAFNGKSYFNTSSQGNPLGGSSVAHGIVIAHGGNTTYGTSLAFRNNRAWFQSLENGSLNPWQEIATKEWSDLQNITDRGNITTNVIEASSFKTARYSNVVASFSTGNVTTNRLILKTINPSTSQDMGSFDVEIFRYSGESYKFTVSSYKYQYNWYMPRIDWISGNILELSNIKFLKENDQSLYLEIIFNNSKGYHSLAITNVQTAGPGSVFQNPSSWSFYTELDTSSFTEVFNITRTHPYMRVSGDSRYVDTFSEQTAIAGNKRWINHHTFEGNQSNQLILKSYSGVGSKYIDFRDASNNRTAYIGHGSSNDNLNLVREAGGSITIGDGATTISHLAGTGDRIVTTNAVGTLGTTPLPNFTTGFVNTTGNQSGIVGDKVWEGTQTVNNYTIISAQPNTISSVFTDPALKIKAKSNPTQQTGSVAITLATSTTDNHGISLSAVRADSSGAAPTFSIRTHLNSAVGVEVLKINNSGRVTISNLSGSGTRVLGANASGDLTTIAYGTTAGTIAQGNDSRINNGQTAFGWGNHANKYVGSGEDNSSSLNTYAGDLNSIQQSGVYASFISTTASNTPFGNVGGFLNFGLGSGITSQLLMSRDGNNLAFRGDRTGSSMSPWRIVWHDGNLTQSSINNWNTAFGWGDHAGLYALVGRSIVAGNGLTGGGTLAANRTITLGTPTAIGLSTTNSVTSTSHTHALDSATTTAINNGNTAFSWGNHALVGYLTSLPNHDHTRLRGWSDTRDVSTEPNDYSSRFEPKGIKTAAATGLNSSTYGSYTSVIGYRGWTDSSGGRTFELGFAGNGQLLYRTGLTTSWDSWNELYHSGNLRSNAQNDARYLQLTGGTVTGTITAPTFSGALSGNATTATRLQTARTINGTSFNGSANITTATWGTARTLTIGKTGKSVNGSGNVAWSLSEILTAGSNITISGNTISATNTNTVTRLRGTTSGTLVSGDITLVAGTNISITQSGNNITINSSGGSGFVDLTTNQTINGVKTFVQTIYSQGDIISFSTSDRRLKKNIKPITNALDKVKSIGGYSYEWKKEAEFEGKDVGIIAQEIEEIIPEVVATRENGYKAVKYEKVIPLLIEAIKELSKQVEDLKNGVSK